MKMSRNVPNDSMTRTEVGGGVGVTGNGPYTNVSSEKMNVLW